jgi:tetratricopeptide (TPR) repeat protein
MLMDRFRDPKLLARVLIPVFILCILGIAPRPQLADQLLQQAQMATASGDHQAAAKYFAQTAELLPNFNGLWEQAGQQAVLAGESSDAITYLQNALVKDGLSNAGQIALGDAYLASDDLASAIHIWRSLPTSIETVTRLQIAHQRQRDYIDEIADLKELILLQPGNVKAYYRLGLLLAVTQPSSAPAYLLQAAERDPQYARSSEAVIRAIEDSRSANEPAYTLLSTGRALASLDEWELAEQALLQAVQIRPDYAEAWAFLGEARQKNASNALPQSGLSELQKAWELDPNSVSANIFLAFYWQRKARYDLALVYLQTAADLDSTNPVLQVELGNTLSNLGDLPAAQDRYEHAIELAPTDPVYWRILAEYSIMHQVQIRQIALPAARQAVILAPKDPLSLDLLGYTLLLLEDYAMAERFLQRAIQVDPGYPPAHLHLGMNYLFSGKLEAGREELLLTCNLAPDTNLAEQARRLLERYFTSLEDNP